MCSPALEHVAEQGELQGNVLKQRKGIQGIVAAPSQRLHDQTAMSRTEYSSSVGVDRISHEKLSGAGQDRTARSVRAAGTEHCLQFSSVKSKTGAVSCSCSSALFQYEGGHCSEQTVLQLLQGDRCIHRSNVKNKCGSYLYYMMPKISWSTGVPKGSLLVEAQIFYFRNICFQLGI